MGEKSLRARLAGLTACWTVAIAAVALVGCAGQSAESGGAHNQAKTGGVDIADNNAVQRAASVVLTALPDFDGRVQKSIIGWFVTAPYASHGVCDPSGRTLTTLINPDAVPSAGDRWTMTLDQCASGVQGGDMTSVSSLRTVEIDTFSGQFSSAAPLTDWSATVTGRVPNLALTMQRVNQQAQVETSDGTASIVDAFTLNYDTRGSADGADDTLSQAARSTITSVTQAPQGKTAESLTTSYRCVGQPSTARASCDAFEASYANDVSDGPRPLAPVRVHAVNDGVLTISAGVASGAPLVQGVIQIQAGEARIRVEFGGSAADPQVTITAPDGSRSRLSRAQFDALRL